MTEKLDLRGTALRALAARAPPRTRSENTGLDVAGHWADPTRNLLVVAVVDSVDVVGDMDHWRSRCCVTHVVGQLLEGDDRVVLVPVIGRTQVCASRISNSLWSIE